VTTVILCRDNDAPGSTARGAFDRAVATHLKAGRIVKVARSPIGKDFNDCLRGRALGSRDGAPSGAVAS
jgi:DNA primase